MHYDLKKPCDNCPFRRKGGVRLRPERAEDISQSMLSNQGAPFACHKTTKSVVRNGHCDRAITKDSQHCAGALIYADKQGRYNQTSRIMMRIGVYNPDLLDRAAYDDVFDDEDEMVEANTIAQEETDAAIEATKGPAS